MTDRYVHPRWISAKDGVAHAVHRGGREYLCGRRLIDERLAWPRTSKCDTCESVVALELIRFRAAS